MSALDLLAFVACVAVAIAAQNLTGFAFALILLALVALFHIGTVADAANAATVLTLVNAWAYFRGGMIPPWRLMAPAMGGGVIGVAAGVALLGWLSSGAVGYLRGLLGLAILGCAVLLLVPRARRTQVSGRGSFFGIGVVSGLLGGLFASSGPPLVYHLYRQPLADELVRRALLLAFAANAAVRLVIVAATWQFSRTAMVLAGCAVPVVYAVTALQRRYQRPLDPRLLRWIVGGLLALAGATLLYSALHMAGAA